MKKEFEGTDAYLLDYMAEELSNQKHRDELLQQINLADINYMSGSAYTTKKGPKAFTKWRSEVVKKLRSIGAPAEVKKTVWDILRERKNKNAI